MTTTLDPPVAPSAQRPAYLRHLAVRTARWTAHVTTVAVTYMYVALLSGSDVAGFAAGAATSVLCFQVAARRMWAAWPLAALWVWWLANGIARHGLGELVTLATALALVAANVAGFLALFDVARQRRR